MADDIQDRRRRWPKPFVGIGLTAVILIAIVAIDLTRRNSEPSFGSPLSDYVRFKRLDLDFSVGTDTSDVIAESQQNFEEDVAECMAAAGLNYEVTPAEDLTNDGMDPASREWAETYGFGVSTRVFRQSQVGPRLVGYPDIGTAPPEENPNLDPVNQMEPAERAVFLNVLTGQSAEDPDRLATTEDFVAGPDAAGCQGEVQGPVARTVDFYLHFGTELADLRQAVLSDPDAEAFRAEIETCVVEAGVPYLDPASLYDAWSDELAIINSGLQFSDGGGNPELSAEAKARLITLQNQETELATAVYDCGGDPTSTAELYTGIAAEHEERFIEEHRERLDQFLATDAPDQ